MVDSPDFSFQFLRTVAGLLIVLAALVCALYGLKRLGIFVKKTRDNELLNVVARHWLDPKTSLVIVRAGNEHFLLGLSSQGLQVLSSLDIPCDIEQKAWSNHGTDDQNSPPSAV